MIRKRPLRLAGAVLLAGGLAVAPAPASADPAAVDFTPASRTGGARVAAAGPADRADVTGDGVPDIVVATTARQFTNSPDPTAPSETGGSLYVIPGGSPLPTGTPAAVVDQIHPYALDTADVGEDFGSQIVTGDFNGDRRADVAIGNPKEAVSSIAAAGAVTVYYGQSTAPYLGLTPNGVNYITQNSGNLPGNAETNDYFGASLTTGDFNGDGYADLAAGAPGESIGSAGSAGAVWVMYGGANGLRVDNSVAFDQSNSAISGNPEKNDHFGSSLAAGPIAGADARDDLVILTEGEDITGTTGAEGSVYVLKGTASGVTATGSTVAGVDTIKTGGNFRSVAVGRFRSGGTADVVVYADQVRGAPSRSGALVVLTGGTAGINGSNSTTISQSPPNAQDVAEADDRFGAALAVGDVDGDGTEDLAVGVPGEDTGGGTDEGAVHVFLGGSSGLSSAVDLFFTENHPLIAANGQLSETFGSAVRFLDVTNDGRAELVVTAPHEDSAYETGAMFVLGLARTSGSLALTSATKLTRTSLGGISPYGFGWPVAGGAVPPNTLPNTP